MAEQLPFKWRHLQAELIYLRYLLSYRGLQRDRSTIYRWGQCSVREWEKRPRPHLRTTNDSWRVDETNRKIKGLWMDLSHTVDSQGNPLECHLSTTRDAPAARRFFAQALEAPTGCSTSFNSSFFDVRA
ncbi:MAG TPA: DDE-type integrase/transposase/recombinase [Ktedonobacteraceae bacterium]|nr:DDE-type integrase/transposase/recombinase [Ktedonobacteraceae bacterium]